MDEEEEIKNAICPSIYCGREKEHQIFSHLYRSERSEGITVFLNNNIVGSKTKLKEFNTQA